MVENPLILRNKSTRIRDLYHEQPKMIIPQLFIKSMLLYPPNPFATSFKERKKMMQLYGAAVVQERSGSDDGGEIARYLKWEYGDGTGLGFLKAQVAQRQPSQDRHRFGHFRRFAGISAGIKARRAAKLLDGLGRELTLLAQWKQGKLRTPELVNRLEELQRETAVPAPSP
jgi:hypothetical protein